MKISISLKYIGPSALLSKAGWLAIAVTLLAINNVSVRADLVAHWTFDEAGGTAAHDSASGLNGTLSASGAGFVSGGISSNAVSLNRAANGFVNMGNVLSLGSGDFSVVAWIKMNPGDSTADTIILGRHESGYGNGYFLGVNQTGGGGQDNKALFYSGGIAAQGTLSTTSVNDGNWRHIVAVYRLGVNKIIYVDGMAEGTNSGPAITGNTTAFVIGGVNESGVPTSRFAGLIDDVQVYDHALSSSNILYLFQNPGKVVLAPPSILTQPKDQTIFVGGTVTLSVVAGGTPPLSYQWRHEGTNLPGATGTSLILSNVQPAIAGIYSVRVTNTVNSVTSTNATLTVTPAPICITPPSGLVSWWPGEVNAFDSANMNHGALNGNATYGPGWVGQGFVFDGNGDGVGIGNPTNLQLQTFTIETWFRRASTNRATSDPGYQNGGFLHYGNGGYAFGIWDDGRLLLGKTGISATYSSALRATDTSFHHAAVTKSGSSVVFYLDGVPEAAGPYDPGFVFNSPVAIGARGGDMAAALLGTIDELAVYNRGLSAAEIQSIYNASIAGKCAIPPTIASQPEGQTAPIGANVTFSVVAFGSSPLSYQWRRNGTNILTATGTSLTLTNLQLSDAADYSVVVSNTVNFVMSSNATLTVTPFPICVPTRSGLVGWWPGEGNTSDSAATNHGTLSGNATFGSGRVGQAFVFDGNGDLVQLTNSSLFRVQNFTVECWIRRTSPSIASFGENGHGALFGYGQGGYLFFMDAQGRLLLGKTGIDAISSSITVTDLTNHHVAVTKTGSSVTFYIDGLPEVAPAYNSTFTFTTPAAIGGRGDNFGNSFYGTIDELAVYNRALSAAEIQSIYYASSAGKCALPVTILTQPKGQTVRVGTNVTLNVVATGTSLLNYQWRFNATSIVGATNSSLLLTNIQPAASGNYTVVITNGINSVTSAPANLSVRYLFVFGNGQNLTNAQYTFVGPATIQLQTFFTNGTLFYTLDGSQPTFASAQYAGPFAATQSSLLRVVTYSADFFQSWEIDPIALTIIPVYSLQASTAGGGTVSVAPTNGPYVSNTVVNVTATPASGWTFLGWFGDASGTGATISITMNRNRAVQARFGTTLSTTVAGNGAVTLVPARGFYPFGMVVQLYGVPQSGNYFVLWGNAGSGSSNPLNFTLTNANPTISSLFASLGAGEFALTVTPDGFGRVMVAPQANRYTAGQNVTLTALPDTGQQFIDWSGDATGTNNPLMIVMNQSKSIVANLTHRPSLSVSGGLNGLNDQGFRLTLTGEFGGHYRIDGSTNLGEWTGLVVLTNTYGTTQFADESATNMPQRFYEAVAVP